MKLLFLDMDGVLNHAGSAAYFYRTKYDRKCFMEDFDSLCPIACSNLNELLEADESIRIVISSTWRCYHKLEEWHEKMKDICPSIVGRVIGKTPRLHEPGLDNIPRGHEIYQWLEQNGHLQTPFVVFDDGRDMDKVQDQFIYVDNYTGLTMRHVDEARKLFKFGIRAGAEGEAK